MVDIFLHLFLIAGFLTSCFAPHMPGRRAMIGANVAACLLFGVYFYGYDAQAGVLALVIAGFSSFLQVLIPQEKVEQTAMLRFGIAAVMSLIAIIFCYDGPTDILPLCAVTMFRFAEAQKSQQLIRYGNVLPQLMWIVYGIVNSLYMAVVADAVILVSYFIGIWREEKARRLRKVPVRVSDNA